MVEGVLLLALLVRAVPVRAGPGRVPVPVAHLTVRARDGIWLQVSRDGRVGESLALIEAQHVQADSARRGPCRRASASISAAKSLIGLPFSCDAAKGIPEFGFQRDAGSVTIQRQ